MSEMATINAQVSSRVKEQAAEVLSSMGMSISDAVTALLNWVAAERHLPFETSSLQGRALTERTLMDSQNNVGIHGPFKTFDDMMADINAGA